MTIQSGILSAALVLVLAWLWVEVARMFSRRR